jgi:hypothetical protein
LSAAGGLLLEPKELYSYKLSEVSNINKNEIPWTESESEPYRPSDFLLSAKLVTTFEDRQRRLLRATDPYGRILGFLDRSRYFFYQVAPQLYSRG